MKLIRIFIWGCIKDFHGIPKITSVEVLAQSLILLLFNLRLLSTR